MNFYKHRHTFVVTVFDILIFVSHIIFVPNYFIGTVRCNEFKENTFQRDGNNLFCNIIRDELKNSEWVIIKGIKASEILGTCVKQTNLVIFGDNTQKIKKSLSKECMRTLYDILETRKKKKLNVGILVRKGNDINYCISRFCISATDKFLAKKRANEQKTTDSARPKFHVSSEEKEYLKEGRSEDIEKKIIHHDKYSVQKILYSIFSDHKHSLFNTPQLISQIRKQKQKQVKDLIRRHNLMGLAVFLSNESPNDMFSFLDVLISGDKSKKNSGRTNYIQLRNLFSLDDPLHKDSEESLPFGSMPTFEDEWNAIVDWIDHHSLSYQFDTNWMVKKRDGVFMKPKIKGNFEASQGFENKFVSQCISGLRSLAYKFHVAPNGDKYYSYNPKNQYGIIIEGRNQYERIGSMRSACKIIFNKYYEYLGVNTVKEDDDFKFKVTGKLNFIAPLNHDKQLLNRLLKSFYGLINDKRREWMAIVYEAKISPLVNSQDLPLEIIPYYFSDESIRREMDLEKKESMLSDKCFETINKLKDERAPGEPDIKLYNIELGSEGIVSQAKFCKGVFERFILRHIEWLKLVIRSIGHEHIKLIDIEDPYLDIPDVFLFPEDARLEENCITTLLIVFEKNIQAIENGLPVKVYPQMDYLGDSKKMVENITSFCKPNSINSSKLNNSNEMKSEIDTESSSTNYSTESKLIELIKDSPIQNPLINIIVNIDDRFNKTPHENQHLDTQRLEKWKAHFEDSSSDSHGDSITKILKSQFASLVNYEVNCEKKIRRYINSLNSRGIEKSDSIFLENYLMETDKLKEEWANEIQSIEDLRNNIRTAESELENYVDVVKFTIQGDNKQRELPQYRKISREWQIELSNKERVYLKMKIDSLLLLQKHESIIESLRYEHLERRKALKLNIKKMATESESPKIVDLEYCNREDEDLYPIYPDFESKEEEDARVDKIRNIDKALDEFKHRFRALRSKLNEQSVGIDSFLSKVQNDFHIAWTESYNTALALQLQIRARALVEEYVRASERYLLIKRVRADYEYRKSLMNEFQTDPSFEAMLSRASEMISKAEVEESDLKNELKRLNEEKNQLPQIVEKDMEEIYSNRIKFIRNAKNILKKSIEQEKKYLNLEEKIFEDQLKRDLEYYKLSDISESAIYRAKQLQILYEANRWILNFNEKLTISYEIQHREDLEKLDYVVTRKALDCNENESNYTTEELFSNLRKYKYKYNESVDSLDIMSDNELKREKEKFCSGDPTKGEIPVQAQTILRMFKEKLLDKLNELDEINQLILQLNLNTVGSFQYYDYNRVKAYTSFVELPYKKGFSNILSVILSHFEWEHIQLRWRIIQIMKHVLEEKEKLLGEISQMRSSIDLKMREFDAIPLSRKLVPIGTLAAMDSVMNEIINGSKKTEDESFEYIPTVIPHYLLSDDDYHKVREYDNSAKSVILNRILMIISTTEGQIVELIKETKDNYEKKKRSTELEILSIKNDYDEFKKTIGYKLLPQEEKDREEQNIKNKISKLTESSILIPLIAKKDILLRKIDKIQSFTRKIQLLFQDPSFTGEKAKELELAVFEFYGSESKKKYDEISPRINLAVEMYRLHDIENKISEIEKLSQIERKNQQNVARLHKLKIEKEETNNKIKELNNEIENITEKINKFQEEKFKMVFEIN